MGACKKRKEHAAFIVVLQRNERCSAFDGYRRKWSAYSELYCSACEQIWRTKASYVKEFPNGTVRDTRAKFRANPNPLRKAIS